MKSLNVLSLCDGMSCGHIALDKAGIKVNKYYAAEIKDTAVKVTQYNYPNTVQIGDVNKISYTDGVLYTENGNFDVDIDMVIFGSPCQSFSIAMKTEHRTGMLNEKKSGLFLECHRILKEIDPKYFLMENVASMKNEDRDFITELMEVAPIMIDSQLVSPAIRKRYYWTSIPNVTQPKKTDISFQSVLTDGYTERKKARCLTTTESRPLSTPIKMFHRHYTTGFWNLIFKSKQHYEACVNEYNNITGGKRKMSAKEIDEKNIKTDVFNGVRYMKKLEMERCQTVPEGYTKCLTRNEAADVLGDGWTIDVIAHIFKGLKIKE